MGGKCDLDLTAGEAVTIYLPDSPPAQGRIAWAKGHAFGVRFETVIDPTAVKNRAEKSSAGGYQVPPQYQPSKDARRPGFRTNHRSEDQKPISKWLSGPSKLD